MKRIYFLTILPALLLFSCQKPEYHDFTADKTSDNLMTLTITATAGSDRGTEFPTEVDQEKGLVTVKVPYYLSDTEPVQADLTKMRLTTNLPLGARFDPPLTGQHNLRDGFKSTLIQANGTKKEYTFIAVYIKSDAALLLDLALGNDEIIFTIAHPAEGADGLVTVPLDEDTEPFISKAIPKVSPWASIDCEAFDAESGILDLSKGKDIRVVSQSGEVISTYKVSLKEPEHLEGLRKVKPLFAIQPLTSNPGGMTLNDNRTRAVVGDYLILSNASDVSRMPVYDRMTGEYLGNNIVNTSTIKYKSKDSNGDLEDNMEFWAIASDDADHLVAATFVDSRSDAFNQTVRIFAWKNGITEPPISIEWAGFYNWKTGGAWAFSNLKVAGDVTGDAVIATSSSAGRAVFSIVHDGGSVKDRFNKEAYGGSLWWSSNIIPLVGNVSSVDELKFLSVSGNHRQYISWNNEFLFTFDSPTEYWYNGGGEYQRSCIGGDYLATTEHNLFGVLNGWYTNMKDPYNNNGYYYQLVVSDLGPTPSEGSLTEGLIFASRHSDNDSIRSGMGYGVNGMISPYSYIEGQTVLGPNGFAENKSQFGDVVIAKTSEKKFQVYGFAMNIGLIAFEIQYY